MGKTIDFAGIADLFHAAHTKGRNFLFEYEVYTPLACAWAETPPCPPCCATSQPVATSPS